MIRRYLLLALGSTLALGVMVLTRHAPLDGLQPTAVPPAPEWIATDCFPARGRERGTVFAGSDFVIARTSDRGVARWDRRGITRIAAESIAGVTGRCAWTDGGDVLCWGGDAIAHRVDGVTEVVEVSTSSSLACARHLGGRVSCWSDDEPTPRDVGVTDATEIAVAGTKACANIAGQTIRCWSGAIGSPSVDIPDTASARGLTGKSVLDFFHFAAVDDGAIARWAVGWSYSGSSQTLTVSQSTRTPTTPDVERISNTLPFDHELECTLGDRVVCRGEILAGTGGALDFSIGHQFGCVRRHNGRIACWGDLRPLGGAETSKLVDVPGLNAGL